MQESWLIEIIPLICILAVWDQYPVLSHPESPQGAPLGLAAVTDSLMATTSFVYRHGRTAFLVQGTLHMQSEMVHYGKLPTLCIRCHSFIP